jgi:uncharacterized membrane protein YhaH (DUF805 family)
MKRKDNILYQLKKNRRMSRATFWMEVATRAISYLCALLVMTMILSAALPGTMEQVNRVCVCAAIVMALVWCIPFVSFVRMRLRDAGLESKACFWLLLPVIGWIVFAGLMCKKGTLQNSDYVIEVL